ncbi:Transmembrane emp24 domain-containing protein eca [Hondaea fermentalgiana]|uniref:Transmembrane emp24 domain-containing protein eca n=1 Tax=Hondaea fermentalgiana TaxID=2315210 RepID=A0A2R5G445_9STRA|nr:Transmembrane emp24 domain-containing protein eca [Hondaea fermentalgiana]|eukprot:GBG25802.1 Transmembrane emp24 domain-containing protein eca [Hondaea fermentalgiana]
MAQSQSRVEGVVRAHTAVRGGMVRVALLVATVLLSWSVAPTTALDSDLYFYPARGSASRRCFIEELPEDLFVIGEYTYPSFKDRPAVIKIFDAQGDEVYSEDADSKGRFAYPARASGEHTICVDAGPSSAKGPLTKNERFHFRLEIHGKDEVKLDSGAKREHLSNLEREIEELDGKVNVILKDIEYSREQEKHFRDQGERINSRIMWWSLFQTLLLLLSGVWQVVHLKNFFRAKKLV